MADNRKIVNGVRVGNETVTDIDKLQEAMTPEMHKRLTETGAITGDWNDGSSKAEQAATKETTKTTKTTKE